MSVKAQKPKTKIKANSVVGNIILWLAVLAVILPLVWVFPVSYTHLDVYKRQV